MISLHTPSESTYTAKFLAMIPAALRGSQATESNLTGQSGNERANIPAPALVPDPAPALPPRRAISGEMRAPRPDPVTVRPEPGDLSGVQVRVIRAQPTPAPLAEVAPLDALSDGPRRLLALLHRLALDVFKVRRHPFTPSQMVIHQSQELLAKALGVHRITVWRWTKELKAAGLIAARAHITTTTHKHEQVNRSDGTLYAVALKAGHTPRLRWDDLKHQYRDLEAQRRSGQTAFQTVQQSEDLQEQEWYSILVNWAVNPGQTHRDPLEIPDCCTVLDVVHVLPLIATAHPAKRPALIEMLGDALARALADERSRRWYYSLLWQAWREEREQRPGLQVLAAQLSRLDTDRSEWAGLKNPAALLTRRMRGSA